MIIYNRFDNSKGEGVREAIQNFKNQKMILFWTCMKRNIIIEIKYFYFHNVDVGETKRICHFDSRLKAHFFQPINILKTKKNV